MPADSGFPFEARRALLDVAPTVRGERLVSPAFHPHTTEAGFGEDEAALLRSLSSDLDVLAGGIAEAVAHALAPHLPAAGVTTPVDRAAVAEWITRSSRGPFDAEFARYLRSRAHVAGGVTVPGLSTPIPPTLVVAVVAQVHGQILTALAGVTDACTLAGVGGAWMTLLALQLGIMLEPVLGGQGVVPTGPTAPAGGYEHVAGLGLAEHRVLAESAQALWPAAAGLLALAQPHLAAFRGSAEGPRPPQLTIALAGWAGLRLSVALCALRAGAGGPRCDDTPFDVTPFDDAPAFVHVARPWLAAVLLAVGRLVAA